MKITITIDNDALGNDALVQMNREELAMWALNAARHRIVDAGYPHKALNLRDHNGNTVGTVECQGSPEIDHSADRWAEQKLRERARARRNLMSKITHLHTSTGDRGRGLRLQAMLARQEELLADLHAHRQAFKRRLASQTFTRARDFAPINPLDEWLEVGHRKGSAIDVPYLVEIGRITTISLNGRIYAREVTA
jgi:hypothetical protein